MARREKKKKKKKRRKKRVTLREKSKVLNTGHLQKFTFPFQVSEKLKYAGNIVKKIKQIQQMLNMKRTETCSKHSRQKMNEEHIKNLIPQS